MKPATPLGGRSFCPLLDNPALPGKPAAFSQYPRGGRLSRSVTDGRYRYTQWTNNKSGALAALPHVRVMLFGPEGAPAVETMPVATEAPKMNANRAALVASMMDYGHVGYRLTLLEIQKLAYFLQLAGQPLRLEFAKQKYGPYAESLNFVLQRMEGHFIRGYGDRSKDASVQVLPTGRELTNQCLASDEATLHRVERVRKVIEGFETPYGMELLATVHWVNVHESAVEVAVIEQRVREWNERKARLFTTPHITAAVDRLADVGWLNAVPAAAMANILD